MKLIKVGSTGSDVKKWQYFLLGQQLYTEILNGKFDEATLEATKSFQRKNNLNPDGVVGNYTTGQAMLLGFGIVADNETDITSDTFPQKPAFPPLVSNEERQKMFGPLAFIADPQPGSPENIKITNGWGKTNIAKFSVPQLKSIKGSDTVWFHKKGGAQLVKLFSDWEKAKLMHKIISWDGAYNPRFVRGSRSVLSNHAFGTAFDINYAWNKLGTVPALIGQKGCVRDLVAIANSNGFYWGGHFSRRDGMHFEISKIIK